MDGGPGQAQDGTVNPPAGKWLTRAIGALLLCASLIFIALQIWSFREQLADWRLSTSQVLSVATGVVIYALACIPLARAWMSIVVSLEGNRHLPCGLQLIYAKSQIGKYIPGNVAHIVGRHVIARERGYGHRALAYSTFYEIFGLLSAAGLVASVALLFSGRDLMGQYPLIVAAPALACLLPAYFLAHRQAARLRPLQPFLPPTASADLRGQLVSPYLNYLAFFLLAGSTLAILTWPTGAAVSGQNYLYIGLAFAASWTLGFLTPGAPSGIGIREAVLIYILSPVIGAPDAVVISILFRLVTVGGDLLYWLAVEGWQRRRART